MVILLTLESLPTHIVTSPSTSFRSFCNSRFVLLLLSNWTSIKYRMVAINTSKVHINNMYIKYTFVHFAILLIRQVSRAVPLAVTISFEVEALSFRLWSSFGLLHGSGNLLAILLEVPFLSLVVLLETNGLVNHQHFMFFYFYLRRFQHREELGESFSSSLAYYSSSRSSNNLVIVTRELCHSLSYLED